jgi:osmotically-inducible protein OsmY
MEAAVMQTTSMHLAVWAVKLLGLAALVVGLAGCAGGPTTKSTGEHIDDTVVTTRVKAALVKELGSEGITDVEVETYKGTVQLSGFVDNDGVRSRAIQVASRVDGVLRVENRLSTKN